MANSSSSLRTANSQEAELTNLKRELPDTLLFGSTSFKRFPPRFNFPPTTAQGTPGLNPLPKHAKGLMKPIELVDLLLMRDRIGSPQQFANYLGIKSSAPANRPHFGAGGERPAPKDAEQERSKPHMQRPQPCNQADFIIFTQSTLDLTSSHGNYFGMTAPSTTISPPLQAHRVHLRQPSDIEWDIVSDDELSTDIAKSDTSDSDESLVIIQARDSTLAMSDNTITTPAGTLDLADLHNRAAEVEEIQDRDRPVSSPGRIGYKMSPLDTQRDEDLGLLATLPATGDPSIVVMDDSKLDKCSQAARRLLREVKYAFDVEKKQRAQDVEHAKKLRDDTPKTTAFRFSSQKSLSKAFKRATVAYGRLSTKFKPDTMPVKIQAAMDAINKLDDLLADDDNEVLDELIHERAKLVNDVHHAQQRMAHGQEAQEPQIQRLASIQKSVATFELRISMLETMWSQQSELAEKGLITERRTIMTVQKFLDSDPMIQSAVDLIGDLVKDVNLFIRIVEEKADAMELGHKHRRHPLTCKLRDALASGWYMRGRSSSKDGSLDAETFRMILETAMVMDLETSKWNLWDETA
ncbi:hypothetical protein ACHAQA_004818 [Verticillium albo-atrum]